MTTEIQATALAAISSFCQELAADSALAERFSAEPQLVLRERDIDIALPGPAGAPTLGDLMLRLEPDVRPATIRSISSFVDRSGPRADASPQALLVLVFAVAVANANGGANANALANANVSVTTNASADPQPASDDPVGTAMRKIAMFSGYADSEVAMRLGSLRLAEARQIALLRRAAQDGDEVVAAEEGDGVRRVTRYSFHGDVFEVESRMGPEGLEILDARVLSGA